MGRLLGASGLVVVACATACAPTPGTAPPPAPPAYPTAPAPPYRPWRPVVDLPVSPTAEPVPASAYPVFIQGRAAYVGLPARLAVNLVGDAAHMDFPHAADTGSDTVEPLARAVEARPCGPRGVVPPVAVVDISAKLPYRLLQESLSTLSGIGYTELYVATRAYGPSTSPPPMGIHLWLRRGFGLVVIARRDGFYLRASRFVVGPRCPGESKPAAGAPDLPASPAGLDFAALERCVDAIAPASSALYLGPDADLSVQTAVSLAGTLAPGRHVALAIAPPRSYNPSSATLASGVVSNASQVVAGMRPDFARCYNVDLATNPHAEGSVKLTIHVGADGNVTSVDAVSRGNLRSTVECVRARAAAARFAPLEDGSNNAVISVPVAFVYHTPGHQGPECTPTR